MLDNIFLQISVLFGITAVIATIIRMLKQPLLVAYILAGIVAGPVLFNMIDGNSEHYHLFSEFGIVLLLFVVGLSLNFHYIQKIGKVAVITGLGQVLFTGVVGFFLLKFLNFSPAVSLFLGLAITFSSTIIITKLLSDKKDTESVYGRYTIGLMLVQDVIAIVIMILLATQSQGAGSLFDSLWLLFLKGSLLIIMVYVLSRFILPLILDHVAKSNEFLFLFTLSWCFGVASLVHWFGFSLEIGAIMAGLSLGASPYQPEISSRVRPLRDFFLILFFIILGSGMNLTNLESALVPGIVLSLFILIGNPLILFTLFRVMRFTRRNSFLAGVTAAQVSEFGFVLLYSGQQMGYIHEQELAIFTLVALITIFASSYIITYNEQIYRFLIPLFNLFGKDKYQQTEDDIPIYDAWVIGHHRMGWKVCHALEEQNISFAVIDFNPEVVEKLKARGTPVYFGDVADVEFLSELPLEHAKMIISTIPESDDQFTLVKYVRSVSKKTYLITNLTHSDHLDRFYDAGANYVMMPHLLGGYRLAEILRKRLNKTTFHKLKKEQEKELALRFVTNIHD